MKKIILIPAIALTLIGGVAYTTTFAATSDDTKSEKIAEQQEQQQLKKEAVITEKEATKSALEKVNGEVVFTELDEDDGMIVYEIKIKDKQDMLHEVKVDAKNGKILMTEMEDNDRDDDENEMDEYISDKKEEQQLTKQAKISEKESHNIALQEVKGQITDSELDMENGKLVYSIEIIDKQNNEHEIEVDAKTGDILKIEKDESDDDLDDEFDDDDMFENDDD